MTEPLYNSRITKNYLEYLKVHHPEADIASLLDQAGMTLQQIEDGGHWFTQEDVDRFHEVLVRTVGDEDISRKVGRHAALSAAAGDLKQYILTFIHPSMVYQMLGRILSRVSRASAVSTRHLGGNRAEITVRIRPGVEEKPYQCENRMGTLESAGRLFGHDFAQIDHPTCIHRGGDACRYILSWETSPSLFWKRLRNLAIPAGAILSAALFLRLDTAAWLNGTVAILAALAVLALWTERMERRDIEALLSKRGEHTSQLLDQIDASYNHALLVHEIGQATANLMDTRELLRAIMKSMERLLPFDRGSVLLANPEKTKLRYADGYGYKADMEHFLQHTEFNLDNPRSRGPFVVAFREQKPFLIDDIERIHEGISAKSREYARIMGVRSFICVPILYEGQSMGLLAVDNIRSHRLLKQSDLNILNGIASQIGVSINRVRTYQKVLESEERFRNLGENAPDIIYTLDPDGAFTYVNPAWETILGHGPGDVVGKNFTDFARPEEVLSYTRTFKRIRDNRETVKSVASRLIGRDGSERLFSISASPNIDSSGQMTGIVGTMKDMTALEKSHAMLQAALQSTIKAISDIIESRDPYTAGHQHHVRDLSKAIAEEMGLSDTRIQGLEMAALIHDIGKVQIPAEILSKPGRLSAIEMSLIRTHPDVGFRILRNIEFHHPVAEIVHQHHERFDGSGYPDGLSGAEILLEARILAVADVVEAMMNYRPYRPALGMEQALDEIAANRGKGYDADVVDACLRIFREKSFTFK
ncbi:MAG: HD domain-containing phosphohydrolase [Syntrophales bacterium]